MRASIMVSYLSFQDHGQDCIVVDDMIDTAGTLAKGAAALREGGARQICACCTHAVLSGDAVNKINNSEINRVYITDTIPTEEKSVNCPKLLVQSLAPVLGEAISRIHREVSLSELFLR